MSELWLLVVAIPFAISGALMTAAPQACIDLNDAFLGRGLFAAPEWARDPVIMRRAGAGVLTVAVVLAGIHFAVGP